MPRSPVKASSPKSSTCSRCRVTQPAARCTSSRTTRSASRPIRRDARSTRYASDLAKGFDVPIVHVNADDVDACIAAVHLADRFPPSVRARRADRSDRLPPLRPQRAGRAGIHAAAMYERIKIASDGARALRQQARSRRACSRPNRRATMATKRRRVCKRRAKTSRNAHSAPA